MRKTTEAPKTQCFRGFLACLTRFERATYRVGVCHSIQLSYRHKDSMVIIASAGAFVNGKKVGWLL